MKDVQFVPRGLPVYRIPVRGLPPLSGWAVKYVSGIDDGKVAPGNWLDSWSVSPVSTEKQNITFDFGPDLLFCFNHEADAKDAVSRLRRHEIETEVVKVGNPS